MAKSVRVRNTTVNGGMTGIDSGINKLFAHKQGASYSMMKKNVSATNTNSIAQQLTRGVFAQTSAGWSGLTEAQRDLWNAEAPNWTGTNIFGDTKPSGKNLFTGCNVALANAGRGKIKEPNSKTILAVTTNSVLSGDATEIDFVHDFSTFNSADTVQLHVSAQKSAGTSKNTQFTRLENYPAGTNINADVTALYSAKYGSLIPGNKIFYKVKVVSEGGNVLELGGGVVVL